MSVRIFVFDHFILVVKSLSLLIDPIILDWINHKKISYHFTTSCIHLFFFSLDCISSAFTDSSTLKRMLKPMPSTESPVTSPESRRKYSYYSNTGTNTLHSHQHGMHNIMNNNNVMTSSSRPPSQASRFSGSRSSHEIGRGYQQQRGMYLDLERERGCVESSPPSDNVIFDNQCYATTPSSSNGNSDQDQPQQYGTATRTGSRHAHHHQVRSS